MNQKKPNFQLVLEKTLDEIKASGKRPRLLIHACCAPCSSYVIEYLTEFFDITLLYYNPNIQPEEEYVRRANELCRLSEIIEVERKPKVIVQPYTPDDYNTIASGLENAPEGGERCKKCYRLRLEKTAQLAKSEGFDYFTTTLSISRHKKAVVLCEIGLELAEKYGVPYLLSDFKKNDGEKRSCELTVKYGLYRQEYCGCLLSLKRK